jgi:hypothetical protein
MVAAALVFLSGCQLPGSSAGCGAVQIDWVDFIQVGSTRYLAGPGSPTILRQSDLGPVVARVRFRVAGNVCDPGYRVKDGDAAFLDPGTPIYEVTRKPADQVLAAERNGQIESYEARSP